MRIRLIGAALTACVLISPAWADCNLSSDANATVRPLNATSQADANLIVSMSMMPKMMHLDYAAATSKGSACEMGQITVNDVAYDLYGADGKGRSRKAIPATKDAPAAMLIAVVDLMKAIDASKQGKAAPTEGYMLATITKADLTGWRLYTGMPDQATLLHDMADALDGKGKPIFRNGKDGKTSLFLSD